MTRLQARFSLALAALLTICIAALAQAKPDNSSTPAADAWMKEPTPYLAWNSGISPALRAARDRVWEAGSMSDMPLTQEGSGRVVGCDYDMTWETSELGNHLKHRVILTATFLDHRSVLSKSERSLYSEVTLRVDKVYEKKTGNEESIAGRDITMALYGGTVLLKDGRVFSIENTCARADLFIQPEHKYLFVPDYEKDGDFFHYAESWDLTDGTLRPSSPLTQFFGQSGHSALSGIKVEQLDSVMAKELGAKAQPQSTKPN
jgi:hypothetical protein